MAEEPLPTYYKFSCPCGANVRIKIDPSRPERHVACPKCDLRLDFLFTVDPAFKRPRVSIVVPMDAVKVEGESLGAGGRKRGPDESPNTAVRNALDEPFETREVKAPASRGTRSVRKSSGKTIYATVGTCLCGASFPVDEQELTSVQSCPECEVAYHVVVKKEPGGRQKTVILVPVKPLEHRSVRPKPPPPDDPPVVERKGRTRVSKGTPRATSKPASDLPPGAQSVPCTCGERLVVRRRDVDRGMSCPGCGRALKFQELRDPQTLAPIVRIRPD